MLTHLDDQNAPRMSDISGKPNTLRRAAARARVFLPEEVRACLSGPELVTKKGPVFHTCIIAGTQAVKNTAALIPFCHAIPIQHCKIAMTMEGEYVHIECEVATHFATGVEMEALTGASIAALTLYDMCKALSHAIVIESIRLVHKSGGKRDVEAA